MNTPATDLKRTLRKLSPVRTESYQIGPHGISAQDSDILVVVDSPLTGLGDTFNIPQSKKFAQTVSRMSGSIAIDREDRKLTLASARAKIELEIQPIKPVPLPAFADKVVSFSPEFFKKSLSVAVAHASTVKSADFGGVVQIQTRPLGLEDETPKGYRIVGTDQLILAVADQDWLCPQEFKWLLNLEAAAIVQLMDGDQLVVGYTDSGLQLTSGDTTVYASNPVKKYSLYEKFLGLPNNVVFSFKPEDWMSGFRTVEALTDEATGISLLFKDGVVQWSSVGVGSTASDESPYEQVTPDPVFEPKEVRLKLGVKFLSGFLSKATGKATLSLTDKNTPVRFESNGVLVLTMAMKEDK